MKIRDFDIGSKHTFVIAEIGNNHNGSLTRAKAMVDQVIEAGADCAKFQMRNLKDTYRKKTLEKKGDDLGTEYVIDLLERFELDIEEHKKIAQYCRKKGILYLCTPWDSSSVKELEKIGVEAYKVASADLTNLQLLEDLSKTNKPLILSTGMSTEEEIKKTVEFLNQRKVKFALLHCNSTYPAPIHDINLKWMNKLNDIHPLIGYSGHERGISVSLAAVGLGACIIERHFTLDREMEGPDHAASLTLEQFSELIKGIREIESALGQGKERIISQGEMINRENLAKSLVATTNISKGTTIEESHIKVCSPGQGLNPQYKDDLIGKVIKREIKKEDFFFKSDIDQKIVVPKEYNFKRPWGVPVRFHDFEEYSNRIRPDLFEFHLSFSDMELNPRDYFNRVEDVDFIVHAPELFSKSHLMDLATPDEEYRSISIEETQKIIDITRDLKELFPKTKKPMIVANIGGFSLDEPLKDSEKEKYYDNFANSLKELDLEGVEIIPQTMAPFPWHFGGQRFQNLFVMPEEIVDRCEKLDLRICFDISHCMLTCNHFNLDFYDLAEKISPVTAYLHIGDARGVNGEGLQIGDGDIDFKRLSKILNKNCPKAGFIPEIWQGHKNRGQGFWTALYKLEGIL